MSKDTTSTSQKAVNSAKKTAKKVAVKAMKTKFNLATIKLQLIVGSIILLTLLVVIMVAGIVSSITESADGGGGEDVTLGVGQAQVSAEVEQYRGSISAELEKYNMVEYTDLLLALMMQESGGGGNDPMQSSESYCGSIGCINNPDLSIEKGVLYFTKVFEKANKDVKLTLQSYNFGGGFIEYVLQNGSKYTKELAISFSQMMYQKLAHTGIYKCHRPSAIQHNACYGDIEYVNAVLKYLPSAVMGDTEILAGDLNSPLSIPINVTSPFGWRIFGNKEFHEGMDISCSSSNSIHSIKKGTVVFAGVMSTYGNLVQVQHEGFITAYGHLDSINVKVGQEVTGGQGVGMCGTTGRSTGEHLHFEVKTQMWGGQLNPAPFLGL